MKIRCLNCGKDIELEMENMFKDELDYNVVCPKCSADFNIDVYSAKYDKGDRVYYLDMAGVEAVGTIDDVIYTEPYKWNKDIKPLYLVKDYQYLRTEEEILELVED